MIFKIFCKYESELIDQEFSYVFKDYRGFSQWNEEYIWCYCFDSNDYNYFYWKGKEET